MGGGCEYGAGNLKGPSRRQPCCGIIPVCLCQGQALQASGPEGGLVLRWVREVLDVSQCVPCMCMALDACLPEIVRMNCVPFSETGRS